MDAAIAALEAGEPHPSKPWKRLEVLGKVGVRVAACDAYWLEVLMALGTFSRPDGVAKDEFLAQAIGPRIRTAVAGASLARADAAGLAAPATTGGLGHAIAPTTRAGAADLATR